MQLTSIIVDDDPMACMALERLCQKSKHIDLLGTFQLASKALNYLDQRSVDLLFLDIEMPEMTGLELAEQIQQNPQIIFTTSKTEYAFEAFEQKATDYLKKPLVVQRFQQAVEKAVEIQVQNEKYKALAEEVYLKVDGKLVRVPYSDLLYFENIGDYIKVFTLSGNYVIHGSLKSIESRLKSPHFLKVHRSFIVNLRKIQDISDGNLIINKNIIPISRANRPILLSKLNIL